MPAVKAVMGSLSDEEIIALETYFAARPAAAPRGVLQTAKFAAAAGNTRSITRRMK